MDSVPKSFGARRDFGIVVIGGGPAGSSLAARLARAHIDVLLVEAASFPRPHIGESLLAISIPLLEEMGVLGLIERSGFIRKAGAIFYWGSSTRPVPLPMPHPGYAYQVNREDFDRILLEHASAQGATILLDARVDALLTDREGRITGMELVQTSGRKTTVTCRWVADASGLHRVVSRRLALPVVQDGRPRIALSAYYRGALRYAHPNDGDVITEACDDGWLWFIPLSDELTSVGFVSDYDLVAKDSDLILRREIASSTVVKSLLQPAGQVRTARRLGYSNYIVGAPLWDRGYVLVGDAAAFVDPLFSTGVHTALYSAASAAAGLNSVWHGSLADSEVACWYDSRIRAHYRRINGTVRLLYGMHPGPHEFWRRRDLSRMTGLDGEDLCRDLGATGTLFFVQAARAGLPLPDAVAPTIEEFGCEVRLQRAQRRDILRLAPEIEPLPSWTRRGNSLVPALELRHRRNRTATIEYPMDGLNGRLMRELDGRSDLADILERLHLDHAQQERALLLAGTLVQAGVLRNVNSIREPEEMPR